MDGKILIIDDIATNRILFKAKLGEARYHPLMASGGVEGVRLARKEQPDLILLDLNLPDLSGFEVLQRLRADPMTHEIPVIVVSATSTVEERLRALEAGADDIFAKPYDDDLLMARLRNLLRSRQDLALLTEGHAGVAVYGLAEDGTEFRQPGHLSIVTDRPEMALKLRRELSALMRDTVSVLNHSNALSDGDAGTGGSDIFVIDAEGMQAERALRLVSDLRSRATTRHAGICLIAPVHHRADAIMAFDLGANAMVSGEMPTAEIAMRLRTVLRAKRRADRRRAQVQDGLRLALIDPLTGLFNRRYATARLQTMAERALAERQALAVMVADIDRFKSVNDRFGHAVGDEVLAEVSRRLGAHLRAEDLLARIGGEEFLIALPGTSRVEAEAVADRLCRQVEEHPVILADGLALTVTVSIGLALSDPTHPGSNTTETLIERADRALLTSKRAGRNKVTLASSAA